MASSLRVETTLGPVIGFADTYSLRDKSAAQEITEGKDGGLKPVLKWLGVKYGKAGRFERPSPADGWTEPYKAWEYGTKFPQGQDFMARMFSGVPGILPREFIGQSEDSHNLNIFAPEGTKEGDNLPVLVWIYGGSLNNGNNSLFLYDPTEWIRRSQSAASPQKFMVVVINYRTNIFGFFAGAETAALDPDGLTGNYGLYDCVSALEWVQSNIKSFGGNPDNVTAFGESAGSFIVSTLLVSGKKLFNKAIMESGAPGTMQLRDAAVSYPAADKIISSLIPSAATNAARFAQLKALPVEELLDLHVAAYQWGGVSLTIETGPKAIWDKSTMDKLNAGAWDPWIDSVIIGTNEAEGSMFSAMMALHTPAAFEAYISSFPSTLQESIKVKYPFPASVEGEAPNFITNPASLLLRDQLFVNPAFDQIKAMTSTQNSKNGKNIRAWFYRCREEVDRLTKGKIAFGAMHIVEIPLVFNTASLWEADSHEAKSSIAFGTRWAAFAISGNPDPNWQPFTPAAPSWLAFESAGEVENEDLKDFEKNMVNFGVRA